MYGHDLEIFPFHCSTLYNDGHATVPKLAEKLTLELVHHIEVNHDSAEHLKKEKVRFVTPALPSAEIFASAGRTDRGKAKTDSDGAGLIWKWASDWSSGETGFPYRRELNLLLQPLYMQCYMIYMEIKILFHLCSTESDRVLSGCRQFDQRRGTQVWREAQRLLCVEERFWKMESSPGKLRRKLWAVCFWPSCIAFLCFFIHKFFGIQLTGKLKERWATTRTGTAGGNCQASSTTRPLRWWSRSRSGSWKIQLSWNWRTLEVILTGNKWPELFFKCI